MIKKVYCIYDEKAKLYNDPFYMVNHGVATRTFSDMVHNPETVINKHPTDYHLYYLGEYDDETATFSFETNPVHMYTALELKED